MMALEDATFHDTITGYTEIQKLRQDYKPLQATGEIDWGGVNLTATFYLLQFFTTCRQ